MEKEKSTSESMRKANDSLLETDFGYGGVSITISENSGSRVQASEEGKPEDFCDAASESGSSESGRGEGIGISSTTESDMRIKKSESAGDADGVQECLGCDFEDCKTEFAEGEDRTCTESSNCDKNDVNDTLNEKKKSSNLVDEINKKNQNYLASVNSASNEAAISSLKNIQANRKTAKKGYAKEVVIICALAALVVTAVLLPALKVVTGRDFFFIVAGAACALGIAAVVVQIFRTKKAVRLIEAMEVTTVSELMKKIGFKRKGDALTFLANIIKEGRLLGFEVTGGEQISRVD